MEVSDFLLLYRNDALTRSLVEYLRQNPGTPIHAKGLSGSLDAVLVAAAHEQSEQHHVLVAPGREEAAYLLDDLQSLIPQRQTLLFPASYKKPYHLDSTENANVLMRAEVLSTLQSSAQPQLIVTYPEALTEKVITKKSLVSNTFQVKKGDDLDTDFLREFLIEYGFEPTDFVYEAGQFAIRGGIIDVFSYSNALPYRIELWGNTVDSLRSFDPSNQSSVTEVSKINLVPDVQTRLLQEERQSFFDFVPKASALWFREYEACLASIQEGFEKVELGFDQLLQASNHSQVSLKPDQLFEQARSFSQSLQGHHLIEYGARSTFKHKTTLTFSSQPQPSFNKNFDLLVQNLEENQEKGLSNIILSNSEQQLERLVSICAELNPFVKTQSLPIALREGFVDNNLGLACYTDHQLFERYHKYTVKNKYSKSKALTIKELQSLQTGDYVTHVDYGVGRFAGLEKVDVGGRKQEAMRLVFRDNDLLYVSIHSLHKVSKYSGKEDSPPVVSKLGSPEWENKKKKAKRMVKDIAKDLIELYAKRKNAPGFAFSTDNFMQAELETSFLYQDTPDQGKATRDVKEDMEQAHPMDRLVCGDVGFGKTEVAIRAAFKATCDNKQVAVLVPTTILAMQHHRTFSERLSKFSCQN
ncbi:MAG: hypothetical protein HC842_06250 [Cytophagales bacterium]|nr:hypothetical protein [Cytophagales bacterium]